MAKKADKNSFLVYKDMDIEGLSLEQVGMLFTAMLDYSNGREVDIPDPEVRGMFRAIKRQMDSNDKAYEDTCERNKQIALEREQKKREEKARMEELLHDRTPDSTNVHDRTPDSTKSTDKDKDKDKDKDTDKDTEKDKEYPSGTKEKDSARKTRPISHKYGEFKHVLLTDDQYNRLVQKHGEQETQRAIRKVDEYCETSGRRYKNYALTLENWGYEPDRNARSGTPKQDFDSNEFLMRMINGEETL